ncbi:MAG TPA: hypothetical protein VEJ16_06600 [Alphaproteobacteria bacterium]|nr:hypothetical protein [Alphaproteobacteria bacterium]
MTNDKLRALTAQEVEVVSGGLSLPIIVKSPPNPILIGHKPIINPPWGPNPPHFPKFPIPQPE